MLLFLLYLLYFKLYVLWLYLFILVIYLCKFLGIYLFVVFL